MARTNSFTKRSLINKANSAIVIANTSAAFILVFVLVAGKSLAGQLGYQSKIIGVKKEALSQLEADLEARDSLEDAYNSFVDGNPNVIGGSPDGTTDRDGDNAKLILDALPSKYDCPALATSLEKLITEQGLTILGINGTDQEADQEGQQVSAEPQPIAMPFQVQVSGSYVAIQNFVDMLHRSIRPFEVLAIDLSGDETTMTATIDAQTFYQPEKSLEIRQEVVQ